MSTEVKFRRGSTTQHATFTGAQGEVTVDTDLNTIRIHDGATVGGHRALLHSEFVGTGTGTVTEIDTGVGLTGGPITASGTLSLDSATQTTLTNAQTAYSWGDHSLYNYLTGISTQNLNNLLNVNDTGITDGQILYWVDSSQQYLPIDMPTGGSGGGVSQFTLLTDTPSSFSSQQYKWLRVNTNEDGLEFVENTGEANLASNKGAGEGHVFYAKNTSTGDLQFRSLRDGDNITITQDANEITIDAASISYTAGTGLNLTNNEFSIEADYVKNTGDWTMSGEITFANDVIFQNQLTFGATLSVEHPSNTEKEVFIRGKVSDAVNDFIELSNASTSTSSLSPAVRGGCDSNPALPGISVIGEIPIAKDTGLYSVMEFLVRKGSDITDYAYGTPTDIQTRPLFDWKNHDTSVMILKPTGLEVENGLTVTGNIATTYNVKFKNSFSLKSGLESAIDATVYPGCVGVANNELYFSATSNNGEWLKVARSTELPTGVFTFVTADSGGSAEATIVTDTLTLAGGTGIDTARSGNVITITNTGGGGGGGSAQDLWKTITADSGSATANSSEDAFTIAGGTGITTAISGDTLTVSGSASDIFKTISVSGQDNVVASGVSDALTFVAGSNVTITTDETEQTVTINSTASGGGGGSSTLAFGTISVTGNADIVAESAPDILTFVAGTGINISTDANSDQITITNSAQASTAFTSIAVASQTNIVADSASDTLTLVAGSNVTLTTNASTDALTIAAAAITQDTYQNIAVANQNTLTADDPSDTLTLVAGTGISIITSTTNDSVTITNTDLGGTHSHPYESKTFAARTFFVTTPVYDYVFADITVTGSMYKLDNTTAAVSPHIYLLGGHTYCFDLDVSGHPFYIKTTTGEGQTGSTNAYNVGLNYWDSSSEAWSTGSNAQGKVSGLLFWTVPQDINGNYIYQCGAHGNMSGIFKIINVTSL